MRSIRTKFKDGDNTVEIVVMDHSKNEEVMIHVELPITWKDPIIVHKMGVICATCGDFELDDPFFTNEEMLIIAKAYELTCKRLKLKAREEKDSITSEVESSADSDEEISNNGEENDK